MGESRQELVAWVNETLDLDITKVEQCGTGAVFCQLFDSIHLDVPMGKVKFAVNTEYQYLNNFKILQSSFTRHQIDRSVPVERLVKCRFQDNLEFLQWFKRYWDANFSGHEYDPVARRKGQAATGSGPASRPASSAAGPGAAAGSSRTGVRTISASAHRTTSAASRPQPSPSNPRLSSATSNTRRSVSTSTTPGYAAPTAGGPASRKMAAPGGPGLRAGSSAAPAAANKATIQALQEAKEHAAALEQENEDMARDCELVRAESSFYFDKLRDIEVLVLTASQLLADRKAKAAADLTTASTDPSSNSHSSDGLAAAASGDIATGMSALGISEKEAEENPELALLNYETLVNEIQAILYSTAEGFERPDQAEGEDEMMGYENEQMDMGETF